MAWEKTHSLTVHDIDRRRIWKVWEDVNHWHLWDADIEFARLEAPFSDGSSFILKPKDGPTVKIKLLKVEVDRAFTDVTHFPLAKMYGIHEMRDAGDGLEISHTVRIEGLLSFIWRKLVAEKVASGLDKQAERMVHRARALSDND